MAFLILSVSIPVSIRFFWDDCPVFLFLFLFYFYFYLLFLFEKKNVSKSTALLSRFKNALV
jgi:hypothetical protein